MKHRPFTAALTAAGAWLTRTLAAHHTTSPRLSAFRLSGGGVMTPAFRLASIPVIIASLLVLAGMLAFPALAQSDPTAPRNLTAGIADGGVLLEWDAPAQDAGSVTGYQVLRRDPSEDAVGVFTTIENNTGDTATNYTDATATQAGKSYTYWVKAWRGDDLSGQSNYARVDLPAEEEEPTPTPTPTATPTPTPTPEPEEETTGPLTGFTLLDASDQSVLATLTDGTTVELDDPDGGDYAIRADVDSGSTIGSVYLELSGTKSHSQTENVAPYSLYGDEGANDLTGEALPVGDYELEATAYSQKNKDGDELGTLSISFTVTEVAPTPTPEPEPLTATFQDLPQGHNGTDTFTFRIKFSEAVSTSHQTLEDGAISVPHGDVTSASRVDGRSDLWLIVVQPDSDEDVNITLPATDDCTATGAVCTEDGKKLSSAVSHTVPGPEPSSGPLTGFTLVDASDQSVLATLIDGLTVEVDDPDGGDYAIRADVDSGNTIGSVHLELTGAKSEARTENVAPCSLYGDGGANALAGGTLPVGSYELEATAYSQGQRDGDELGTLSVSFTVAAHTPTPVPPTLSASALHDGRGVVLSWNRPAEDADSVTGYEILRAVGSCRMTTLVADTESQTVAHIDEDATIPGQNYAYQVRTIMGEERSAASNRVEVQLAEATTTAEQDASSPVAPNLCAWAIHDGRGIVLSWSKPAENADSVTGYEILRALDDGEMTTLVDDTQSKSVAYIDAATESGKTHAYQVKTIMGEQKRGVQPRRGPRPPRPRLPGPVEPRRRDSGRRGGADLERSRRGRRCRDGLRDSARRGRRRDDQPGGRHRVHGPGLYRRGGHRRRRDLRLPGGGHPGRGEERGIQPRRGAGPPRPR